jgi:hypothetical protein
MTGDNGHFLLGLLLCVLVVVERILHIELFAPQIQTLICLGFTLHVVVSAFEKKPCYRW